MNVERKEAENKLMKLVGGMEVPAHRKNDVKWLHKNIKKRNAEHIKFSEAEQHISMMIEKGWY